MSIKSRFSTAELERIKSAVHTAEDKISGEIVPVFVEKSGFYSVANYRAAVAAGSLVFLLIILFDRYMPALAIYDPLLIFLLIVMFGLVGALISNHVDFVRRIFIPQM